MINSNLLFNSCDGISVGGVIAVGSHGTIKNKVDRRIFADGLLTVVSRVKPSVIIVYGRAPEDVFNHIRELGVEVIVFESEFSKSM